MQMMIILVLLIMMVIIITSVVTLISNKDDYLENYGYRKRVRYVKEEAKQKE